MKRILVFIMALLPYYVFSQFSISGKVMEKSTEITLAGAHVYLDDSYQTIATDENGEFSFKNLKKEKYIIKISFLGYNDIIKEVDLNSDVNLTIEMESKAILEDEVIIKSTRAEDKTPTTFVNIDKKKIKEVNLGQDIPFILETVPSTVVTSDAGGGIGYSGLRIRGTDITRINVTVNGIPLNDPESHGVYWVNMPDFASSIENIQVQRGVGTSTNGAAAFGASINLQTNKLNPNAFAEINSSAGSFNTFKNNIILNSGLINKKWAFEGRLSKISSDGYIDRASSDLKSFFVSGGYYGKKSIVKLNIFSGKEITYQAWNGISKEMLETDRTYNSCGEYIDENGLTKYYNNQIDNYQQDHYQLFFSQKINIKLNFNSAVHYTKGYGYYESYKEDEDFADYGLNNIILTNDTIRSTNLIRRKILDNDFYGLTFSFNYDNKKKTNIIFGGSWNKFDGDHYGNIIWAEYAGSGDTERKWYDNTGVKTDFNLFAKINYKLNKKLNLYGDLQFRNISYEISGIHDDFSDLSQNHKFTFINPKLGLFYEFNQKHSSYFSYAMANREPNRGNYRDADDGYKPKEEKLFDYELGYNYKSTNYMLNANLFFMDYKDQLVLTGEINNVGSAVMKNVDESYRIGIELTNAVKILSKLRWETNVAYSKNKIKNFIAYVDSWDPPYEQISENLDETDLSFSPELIVNNSINYEIVKDLNISLMTKYVSEQYIDNSSSDDRKLESYLLNNIKLNYNFKSKLIKEIGIYVLVNNIFDVEYETNAWVYRYYSGEVHNIMDGYYPQAGINFLAGLSLKF